MISLGWISFASCSAIGRHWCRCNIWALKYICKLDYRVEGAEHIPTTPTIVLSKHQSAYETYLFMKLFPPISWVLKRELFLIPVFGWSLALTKPIAIDRKAGARAIDQVVKQGIQSLKEGRWVVIFPEGTRTRPGSPVNYRAGGSVLAVKSGQPILPVALNTGAFWPKGQFIKYPGTITVCFGPLIETTNKTSEEVLAETKAWIENKMEEINQRATV
ncbi:MAG: 1-acyl-sn-glycerol-3-phosphate acyltransferase [Gammaproteobacteria bacterium]|nr:1-acyl-sn-glycerol-3-phosphate acyltransferase [Gammaproteobacteria bacterium]